ARVTLLTSISIGLIQTQDVPQNPGLVIQLAPLYKTISFLLSDKRVRLIGVVYLLVPCAWGCYGQGIALFLSLTVSYTG
ncbi:MFS transporter, partial [Francisella tularensis subsp. holarctica]|nr:MFS transporter [Francisella tularensis subsp. holarctica]